MSLDADDPGAPTFVGIVALKSTWQPWERRDVGSVDEATRSIVVRIVVWGPRGAGKTMVLDHLVRTCEKNTGRSQLRDEMAEHARFPMPPLQGFSVDADFFAAPDDESKAAELAATADGVFFVADSLARESNRRSMAMLVNAAEKHGRVLSSSRGRVSGGLPLVVLYNKQDLEGATAEEELRSELNALGFEDFAGVARTGVGVSHLATTVVRRALMYLD